MKRGMVYIESLMASVITIILVVCISKLILQANNIVKDTREKGRAVDIVRTVSSLYQSNKDILIKEEGIRVSNSSDVYGYLDKGLIPQSEGEFTLYATNAYEEDLQILKIEIVSNNQRFKTISMVVTK